MNTATQQFTRHVSVPHDEGVRVDKAVTIDRPITEVYRFWRQLDNLPRFLRHVKSVTVQDDLHSHWAVKTMGGKVLEWDAEIIEQRDNEMFSWRSAPGADVDNAGSVWFTPVPGGQETFVRLQLKYLPPAGAPGALIAKLFGRDAGSRISEDLDRLKALLETGQLPANGANGAMWRKATRTVRDAAQAADTCVHANPWAAIGSAAACGFGVGFLVAWRLLSSRK